MPDNKKQQKMDETHWGTCTLGKRGYMACAGHAARGSNEEAEGEGEWDGRAGKQRPNRSQDSAQRRPPTAATPAPTSTAATGTYMSIAHIPRQPAYVLFSAIFSLIPFLTSAAPARNGTEAHPTAGLSAY
jgi:hypothetical protein